MILLVNPKLHLEKGYIDYPYLLSYNLYMISAFLKEKGYDVEIFDSFTQKSSVSKTPAVIGNDDCLEKELARLKPSTTIILNSPYLGLHIKDEKDSRLQHARSLIRKIRASGSRVLLADCFTAGMHYYDYEADKILKRFRIDAICRHESELGILKALQEFYTKCLPVCHKPHFVTCLDSLPSPAIAPTEIKKLFEFYRECTKAGLTDNMDFGLPAFPYASSRGCVYRCSFCSSRIYRRKYREHSLARIDKDFKMLAGCGVKRIVFLDDLLNITNARLLSILSALKKHGLKCYIPNGLRADRLDESSIRRLKELTEWIKVSAETASKDTMKQIGKMLCIGKVEEIAGICRQANLPLYVHFIIGFDKESVKAMNKTLGFALQLKKKYSIVPLVQLAAPINGAPYYNQAKPITEDYMSYFIGKAQKNGDALAQLLRNYATAGNRTLEKAIINITYKCNNNCIMCAVGDRKRIDGDYQKQKLFLENNAKSGVTSLDIDGGEPTMCNHLIRLIRCAKQFGYRKINVTTNGRLLSNQDNARKLLMSGIDSVLVSLHGPRKEIHESVTRSEGSFIETVMAINTLKGIKTQHPVEIAVNTTITKSNIRHLGQLLRLCRLLGISKVNIQQVTPFGNAQKNIIPSDRLVTRCLRSALSQSKGLMISLINFNQCKTGRLKLSADTTSDTGKLRREMMFISDEEGKIEKENLFAFLSKKRIMKKKCQGCIHYLVCGGEWDYGK